MVELYTSPYDVKSQASLESLEATLESSLKSLRASLKSSLKSLGQVRSQDTSSLVQVNRPRPNLHVGLTVGGGINTMMLQLRILDPPLSHIML